MAVVGVKTRRARREEARLLGLQKHAAASGPFVRLSKDLLFTVFSFCDGATLGRLESTCRLFGLPQMIEAEENLRQSLPEQAAAFQMEKLRLGATSLLMGAEHQREPQTPTMENDVRRIPPSPFSAADSIFWWQPNVWPTWRALDG